MTNKPKLMAYDIAAVSLTAGFFVRYIVDYQAIAFGAA